MDALKQISNTLMDGFLVALFLTGCFVALILALAFLLTLALHPIVIPFVLVGLIGLYGLGVLANKMLS